MSKDFQPRQPKGIPIGGQYATTARGEGGVSLAGTSAGTRVPPQRSTPLLDRLFGDAERHDAFERRGYVPPTYFAAVDDPRSTRLRREWWEQHFVSGEHRADGDGYPKMPDDYTPSRTVGRALSGHRRTHRMRYEDNGVTFRMPSVTSIKRYAQETGTTFDVPVSAVDENGRPISGWVRVTNNGAGVWSAEGLGFNGVANAKISEAVASRLESRRPRRGPRQTGDLLERHKARLASQGAETERVRSTWISAVGYNSEAGVMFTETSNGKTYGHYVDPDTFNAVRGDRSPGAAFNAMVKGSPTATVTRCGKCNRVYAEVNGHTCPTPPKTPAPGPKPVNLAQRAAAEQIARGAQRLRRTNPGAADGKAGNIEDPSGSPRVVRRRPRP